MRKQRYWLYRRAGVFYLHDSETGVRESLATRRKQEAEQIRTLRNLSAARPVVGMSLAKATDGLTGSEIEQLFIDALHEAFNNRTEPTDLSVALLLNDFMPLSKLMSEQVDGLRKWAKGRARRATALETGREGRKIAA